MSQGAVALEAVRGLRKRLARVLLVSEIRAIAADDLWLSGASGRPTLALHFTWRHNARKVVGLLPGLQEALAPFSARPHWGKVWRRFSLDPAYPSSPTRETCSSASTPMAGSATITCSASASARPASHDALAPGRGRARTAAVRAEALARRPASQKS
jgi:hypothetical protein